MTYPRLDLERDEDPDGVFITLAVRMKLDLAGIRISLGDWQALPTPIQTALHDARAETDEEILNFRETVRSALTEASRPAPEVLPDSARTSVSRWKNPGSMPVEVSTALQRINQHSEDWNAISRFSRYVLWSFATRKGGRNFENAFANLRTQKLI